MRVMTKMILAVACGVSWLLLTACGAEWEREAVSRSPDGRLLAIADYKNSPACCSDHSRLRLQELSPGTLDEEPGIVVEVTRAKLRPHWESNDRLVAEACGATNYEATSRVYRRDITRPDGSESAVRLDVISVPNTIRNGRVYCATSVMN